MRYEFRPATSCNMCGGHDFNFLGMRLSGSQGPNPRKAEGVGVPVKRCETCGLIFSDPQPIPEKLSDHYGIPPADYWGQDLNWTPGYFSQEIAAAKELINFVPGMKALDIGAGTGLAMKSLTAAGFDTWGIEPSEPFRRRAIETGTASDRMHLETIDEANFASQRFDFITFGAVLEHLVNPHSSLEKALGWLNPGGIIHVEVPSSDWLIAKLVNAFFRVRGTNYVTHISPMHAPFHLYEFTLRSFRDFKVVSHSYEVCEIPHVPDLLKPSLRWWMNHTKTGMQLTVYLRHT